MSSSKVKPPSGTRSKSRGHISTRRFITFRRRVKNSSKTLINVLVVGESGVGKSTFINCIPNYAEYTTIEEARKFELKCLIPTQVTICDENGEPHVEQFGNDTNEDGEIGSSKTQGPRSYVFPLDDNRQIRLIDTPGSYDVRGNEQDDQNFENVLDLIHKYEYLHAICILLKPNEQRLSDHFKYCLSHLLSRLDKSAAQNIIFIFTNTSATSYKPKGTLPILRKYLQDIERERPYVKIPCDAKNYFCMDNEGIEYLIGLKLGYKFSNEEKERYSSSWKKSAQAFHNFLGYICGENERDSIKPHLTRNTLKVNEVKNLIQHLIRPLSDHCNLIHENLSLLDEHETDLEHADQSIEELEKKMYIPSVILVHHKFEHPRTVCTSAKCTERTIVNGKVHNRYKQICCENCYAYFVTDEYKGSRGLYFCGEMGFSGTCTKCECSFWEHMRTYYDVEPKNVQEKDESVEQQIASAEKKIHECIAKLQVKKEEYKMERETINNCMAKFAYFLKDHAIVHFGDEYEKYLDNLIERERSYGSNTNKNYIDKHVSLLEQYQEAKRWLEARNPHEITIHEVEDSVSQLYDLKHTGEKIKELHLAQQRMSRKVNEINKEYIHSKFISKVTNVAKTTASAVSTLISNVSLTKPTMGTSSSEDDNTISKDN